MDREFFEKKALEVCEKISKKADTMELSDIMAVAFTEGYFAGREAALAELKIAMMGIFPEGDGEND